jgi:hypothetical protein
VLSLLRAAVAVLVVLGTDQLALGVIEQPLVDFPIPVGIELAAGERASVSKGQENSASGTLSSVSGGGDNTARGEATSINGGGVVIQPRPLPRLSSA